MDKIDAMKYSNYKSACAIITNQNAHICYANEEFYNLLAIEQNEFQSKYGNRLSAIVTTDNFLYIKDFLASKEDHTSLEVCARYNGNESIWLLLSIQKINDESDTSIIFFFDIQRYKRMEDRFFNLSNVYNIALEIQHLAVILYRQSSGVIYHSCLPFIPDVKIGEDSFPQILLDHCEIHPDFLNEFHEKLKLIEDVTFDSNVMFDFKIKIVDDFEWTRLTLSKYNYKEHTYIFCMLSDIETEKNASLQYMNQSLFYQTILSAQDAYAEVDVNTDSFVKLGGLWNLYNEVKDEMGYEGLSKFFINKVVHTEDRERYIEIMNCKNLKDSYEGGIVNLGYEFRRIVDQNAMSWMALMIHLFVNPFDNHLMALIYIKNIDDKKQTLLKSGHHAQFDELTQLFDYNTIQIKINEYLSNMNEGEICAYILFDINHMKDINAKYGYFVGDRVLCAFSEILAMIFRKNDILGRYWQDQFIVLLKDVANGNLEKRLKELISGVNKFVEHPFDIAMGILYAKKDDKFEECYHHASLALLKAKEKDVANAFEFYDVKYLKDFRENEKLESELNEYTIRHLRNDTLANMNMHNFDELVGEFGDISYLVDPENYQLMIGNKAFYERLGLTQADCQNRCCYELLHHRTSPCSYCQKSNWSSDKFYMYQIYNTVLDQEFLIKNKLVNWRGRTALLACAVDLSNDKTITDLIQGNIPEEKLILDGIHSMQKETTKNGIIKQSLKTIGEFFRADCTHFWKHTDKELRLISEVSYCSSTNENKKITYTTNDINMISDWLYNHKWNDSFQFENPQMMILESYDLYHILNEKHIDNQYWFALKDENEEFGIFQIDNLHANFKNTSFLNSFSSYICNEWIKCTLMEDIYYNYQYDLLTGLFNRRSYDAFINTYNPDEVSSIAIITFDINTLRDINSSRGTVEGDRCLQTLSKEISDIFDKATNYHLGSDEFQSIWLNVDVKEVEEKIALLRDRIAKINSFSISIGYSYDNVEKKLGSVVEYASNNLTVDKNNQAFRVESIRKIDHYRLQSELIEDINNKNYVVYLQPKCNAKNGNVIGAEALIRYIDSNGSLVPPSEYIPTLEKTGLIRYIDLFVFEEMCKLIRKWLNLGKKIPVISLNFSRITMMEQNLIDIIDNIIKKYDTPKKYIEIEITENSENVGTTLLYQSAKKIHEAGYSIALDDFGTNFTNLSILSDIHVDVLKIDKSLIHSMEDQRKNLTVLKHIIDMCNDLHISVIAEGVENMKQRNSLMELGCFLIQGYLFSRPLDIETFEKAYLPRVR